MNQKGYDYTGVSTTHPRGSESANDGLSNSGSEYLMRCPCCLKMICSRCGSENEKGTTVCVTCAVKFSKEIYVQDSLVEDFESSTPMQYASDTEVPTYPMERLGGCGIHNGGNGVTEDDLERAAETYSGILDGYPVARVELARRYAVQRERDKYKALALTILRENMTLKGWYKLRPGQVEDELSKRAKESGL